MTDIAPYTPLKRIVAFTLDELNKSLGDYERYWTLAFRALVHMTYQVSGQTVTQRLMVDGNKTVKLPPNCLSWTKIGVLNERGEVVTLRVNGGLTAYKDLSPARLDNIDADVSSGGPSSPYYANYYYQGATFQLFGARPSLQTFGECRVDEAARVIILNPDFAYDSLIVEYIDIPEKNADYQIPTCLQEAVIAFIKWKDKQGPREEFYAAMIEGRRALPKKKVTAQSINQIVREGDGFKLKG